MGDPVRVDAEQVGVHQGLGPSPSVLRGDVETNKNLRHEMPEVVGGVARALGGHSRLLCGSGAKVN